MGVTTQQATFLRGKYWLLPVATAFAWLIDLLGLLVLWACQGYPRYRPWLGQIVYISNIAAATPAQHAFFMVFSVITAVLYMATTLCIRHLRHTHRIPSPELAISVLCEWGYVGFTFLGCFTLIVLSIMDATTAPSFHWSCTISFIVFLCIAVFFQACELFSLAYTHRTRSKRVFHSLVVGGSIKLFVLLGAILLALMFAVMYLRCDGDARKDWHPDCERSMNVSAGSEWAIAFLFFFYFGSNVHDTLTPTIDPEQAYRQRLLPIDSLDSDDDEYPEDSESLLMQDSLAWSAKQPYVSAPIGSDDSFTAGAHRDDVNSSELDPENAPTDWHHQANNPRYT